MPNRREIWNLKPQNHLHWGMLNSSIANFFAILLHCTVASIVKNNNILLCRERSYEERGERWERKDIILRYIILMSKRGK